MPDREKVIRGLLCIKGDYIPCATCKYANADGYGRGDGCKRQCVSDAIALLKEQETTFEKDGHHIRCKSCGAYFCDRDREGDQYPQNFCPNCGKAVKLR